MMLRCEHCGKSVMLLDDDQAERMRERPSAYTYLCGECRGDVLHGEVTEDDADGD